MKVKIKKLNQKATIPAYQTKGAACFDLAAAENVEWEDTAVPNVFTAIVPTGLAFEIPEGYRMDLYPRSGWGFKKNIQLANGTGKIDSDYRGEVMVKLIAFTDKHDLPTIEAGTRICQAEINEVIQAEFVEVEEVSETERGTGGFGSTGH